MQSIIVIGAGILGASAAYHLVKLGAKVTLIDREDPGQATDAAAGIVCPWISQRRNQSWYQLAKGGARYYPDLISQLEAIGETDTGYKRVGALSLHHDPNKLEQMAERTIKRREDAPEIGEVAILTPAETIQQFPLLAETWGSVYVGGAARVNGRALRNALIQAANKHGAAFLKGDAQIVREGNKVIGVRCDGNLLYAEQVIDTAGAWSKQLLQPIGVDFLVRPQKAQIIHLMVPATNTNSWPVVMPPNNQYILAFHNGRVVVGSTHENEAGFDTSPTAGGIGEILGKVLETAPGLSNSTFLETRVGFRPFTPGFLPIAGQLPHFEGIYIANGLGSSGLTSGPYLGAELAKLVLGKETEIDFKNYDPSGAFNH
ncbi:FAD-binding oxidoreductase [Bacillus sp. BRMEA1]|uniref:NAD(P)/FAD-dependent oxidoreductase n=1 Tax=Neobacillus endophyticus TaxID=2738405 RepID=UPI0015644C16|nr:FAD-binding oxidoreductase [Neobacillus endophyticus]NRD80084.1 FAD-binding oxidoreductase [Neobacillus endophyticus]